MTRVWLLSPDFPYPMQSMPHASKNLVAISLVRRATSSSQVSTYIEWLCFPAAVTSIVTKMSLQQARWRPLMPFLYPQKITWPARSIHFQPTNRNHAKVQKSMAVQMQQQANKKQDLRGDLGLLEGPYLQSRISVVGGKLTPTVRRPLLKTYRTQKAFPDLGFETVDAIAMGLGES